MEFDDLQAIWDKQSDRKMYAFDQEALHRRVKAKQRQANRMASIMEKALIGINLFACTILLIINWGEGKIFNYISIGVMLSIILYLLWSRRARKKMSASFEPTMLGDLNQAISTIHLQINRLQTMIWWYILPVAIPAILNMITSNDKPLWQWIFVLGSFVLGYVMVMWEARHLYQPKLKALETLRDKLTREFEQISDQSE